MTRSTGRVESTGCVTSGRRWHRRTPCSIHRFGAARQEARTHMTAGIKLFGAIAIATTLSGCALSLRNPDIADLRQHPGRYQDRTVSVSGVVTSSWGLPLLPFRFYKV